MKLADFPGESARASLKREEHAQGRGCDAAFPGRIRPGLIEASSSSARRGRRPRDFPGESARASLKRPAIGQALPRARAFPGRIRPGLIEAC